MDLWTSPNASRFNWSIWLFNFFIETSVLLLFSFLSNQILRKKNPKPIKNVKISKEYKWRLSAFHNFSVPYIHSMHSCTCNVYVVHIPQPNEWKQVSFCSQRQQLKSFLTTIFPPPSGIALHIQDVWGCCRATSSISLAVF